MIVRSEGQINGSDAIGGAVRSEDRELRWLSDRGLNGRLRFDRGNSIGAAPLEAAIAIGQGLRLADNRQI